MVPNALYAQEVFISGCVALSSQWVNEEVLRDLPAPREHQNPAVNPHAQKRVCWWTFLLLSMMNRLFKLFLNMSEKFNLCSAPKRSTFWSFSSSFCFFRVVALASACCFSSWCFSKELCRSRGGLTEYFFVFCICWSSLPWAGQTKMKH